jgi:hypothetical protein
MPSDVNLVRAHFQSALSALSGKEDFLTPEQHQRVLASARLSHGAGLRRLLRIPHAPWLADALDELHLLEQRVRSAIDIVEREQHTTRYFMTAMHP